MISPRGPVLLVEDSENDVLLTQRALRARKTPVPLVVVRDGSSAIDFLEGTGDFAGRDPAETPRLILLDLTLPRVDGLSLLRHLRSVSRTRTVPVVVLTTSGEPTDVRRSYELGANSFVRKPTEFDQFTRLIDSICGYWLEENVPPPRDTEPVGDPMHGGVSGPRSDAGSRAPSTRGGVGPDRRGPAASSSGRLAGATGHLSAYRRVPVPGPDTMR